MESFRILACIAFLAVCAFAEESRISQQPEKAASPSNFGATPVEQAIAPQAADGVTREKKQALYPLAYSAGYPYYSGGYGYGYAYPYAYSAYAYGAYDDGKYYPGKYERPYYRSYPGYYNSPYNYYY